MATIWIVESITTYYPAGGTGDILGVYDNEESAQKHYNKLGGLEKLEANIEPLTVLSTCPEKVTRTMTRTNGSQYETTINVSEIEAS